MPTDLSNELESAKQQMETETLDRLYLEISQFTKAKTNREIELEYKLARFTKPASVTGVDVQPISPSSEWCRSPDAQVWACQWMKHIAENPGIATDEGTMLAWFANAIMAGYDHAKNSQQPAQPQQSEPAAFDSGELATRIADDLFAQAYVRTDWCNKATLLARLCGIIDRYEADYQPAARQVEPRRYKGDTIDYDAIWFAIEQLREHFTDEWLPKGSSTWRLADIGKWVSKIVVAYDAGENDLIDVPEAARPLDVEQAAEAIFERSKSAGRMLLDECWRDKKDSVAIMLGIFAKATLRAAGGAG
jgi:hypothetical protein